ncbi:MAG: D-glycerate dehydrogenase [Proteobacteria bacterium]|nr:D-glycerate dehydrogenase [Pseudomonadota bacterium]
MSERAAILVTRKMPDVVEERLKGLFRTTLNPKDEKHAPEKLIELSSHFDGFMIAPGDAFRAETVKRLSERLKIIATATVGYDHIDVAACKTRGITVTNTPDVLTDATADLTLFLMLGAARRAHEWIDILRTGRWGGLGFTSFLGTDLKDKRLGIYGMGRIGQAVAKRARGFAMEVHYHNRRRLPCELEEGAYFHRDINEFLRHSEVLTIHCPATPETRHFLNAERIARLPDGAIVINTARGSVVDDEALIAALKSGKVQAAGLDVFENEPKLHPEYLKLPNAFLTPHIGSATRETRTAMADRAVDNLEAFFAGREPGDRVA